MEEKDNEQIEGLMQRMQNIGSEDMDGRKEIGVILGLFYHQNILFHLLIGFGIALAAMGILYLITSLTNYSLFVFSNDLYLFFLVALFVMIDYLFKYFMMRFTPRLLTYSLGLVCFLLYFPIFFFIDFIMKNALYFPDTYKYLFFVVSFGFIRFIISTVLRRLVIKLMLKKGE